jgi:hypothetical protein
MSSKKKKTASEIAKDAFTEVVQAIAHDMPLVMHGSGDVQPSAVNPDSVALLSELTANYIANLVEAAVDAHAILNDGPKALPPPPLPKSTKTTLPAPYIAPTKVEGKKRDETKHRKRRRATDEFWDEPLPEPKIKNKAAPQKVATETKSIEGVSIDEWVGVSGVDFWEADRARKAHVTAPAAIGTPCFIFPVCHDVGLYGKVREVQQARRSIAPLLLDPVLQDMVRNEGALQGPGALRRRDKKASNEEEEEEPEETDSGGEGGATWPGLDSLLPVHVMKDFLGGK